MKGSEYLLGYAYEVGAYEINTYLVFMGKNFKIVLDKYYNFSSLEKRNEIIDTLTKKGYRKVEYWEEKLNNGKKLIKKY